MRRDNPFAQTVVSAHRELDRGTLRAILRQTDIGVEDSFDWFERAGQRLCLPGRALAAAPPFVRSQLWTLDFRL